MLPGTILFIFGFFFVKMKKIENDLGHWGHFCSFFVNMWSLKKEQVHQNTIICLTDKENFPSYSWKVLNMLCKIFVFNPKVWRRRLMAVIKQSHFMTWTLMHACILHVSWIYIYMRAISPRLFFNNMPFFISEKKFIMHNNNNTYFWRKKIR